MQRASMSTRFSAGPPQTWKYALPPRTPLVRMRLARSSKVSGFSSRRRSKNRFERRSYAAMSPVLMWGSRTRPAV